MHRRASTHLQPGWPLLQLDLLLLARSTFSGLDVWAEGVHCEALYHAALAHRGIAHQEHPVDWHRCICTSQALVSTHKQLEAMPCQAAGLRQLFWWQADCRRCKWFLATGWLQEDLPGLSSLRPIWCRSGSSVIARAGVATATRRQSACSPRSRLNRLRACDPQGIGARAEAVSGRCTPLQVWLLYRLQSCDALEPCTTQAVRTGQAVGGALLGRQIAIRARVSKRSLTQAPCGKLGTAACAGGQVQGIGHRKRIFGT